MELHGKLLLIVLRCAAPVYQTDKDTVLIRLSSED